MFFFLLVLEDKPRNYLSVVEDSIVRGLDDGFWGENHFYIWYSDKYRCDKC